MSLLDIIFPEKCLYCKKLGKYICKECYNKLNNKYYFKKFNNDYFDYVICGSFYKETIRAQLHNFKFHEQSYLYKYFIELILNNAEIYSFLKKFNLITYIPMTKNKKLIRGYNQAELLAKELGKSLNIEVLNLLEKLKENRVQSSLSKTERIKNVEDVFEFSKKHSDILNKNIILVDDIYTTGSTARACSKIIKENGANKICVFTVSKTSN